jgi:transaldolase
VKATQALHELGQSLWIDDITRDMLDSGTLKKYIDDFSVTGLTSNPTIFDNAIAKSDSYDAEIKRLTKAGFTGEALFFELALQDLSRAADLFLPIHGRTSRTCSSRFRAPRKACPPSKRRSSPASPST